MKNAVKKSKEPNQEKETLLEIFADLLLNMSDSGYKIQIGNVTREGKLLLLVSIEGVEHKNKKLFLKD